MTFLQNGNVQELPELRRFYWYTAKRDKKPPCDVSYMSDTNTRYGFGSEPSMEIINEHDLRFTGVASWDKVTYVRS